MSGGTSADDAGHRDDDAPDDRGGRRDDAESYRDLLDEARADEAARSRATERWLRQQAQEGADFLGVLLDLGERGDVVTVRTVAGHDHRGRITGVARDFIAMRTVGDQSLFVRSEAVAFVRPEPGVRYEEAAQRDVARHDRTFAEQLAWIAADRPRVTLVATADREPLIGQLRSVGEDVATIRLDGSVGTAYVHLEAVSEALLLDS